MTPEDVKLRDDIAVSVLKILLKGQVTCATCVGELDYTGYAETSYEMAREMIRAKQRMVKGFS